MLLNMSVTVKMIGALRRNSSCFDLKMSEKFINPIESLHYDIFIAIVWIVNNKF